VRVDKDDNIWAIDKGSDMIIRFNPEGRVTMVSGRKKEASDEAVPWTRTNPPRAALNGQFRQPTDVTWGTQGDIFISDGYTNSRVAKYDKNGRWAKQWGERGSKLGEFNTPHSIAADAKGNIYVADRGNRRIQVFDPEGKFEREITIDVPVPPGRAAVDGRHAERGGGSPAERRALGNLHHAGRDAVPLQRRRISRSHIQAVARREVLGMLGTSGRQPKEFG